MTLTLEFEFEDGQALYNTAMAVEPFREENQSGRFETVGRAKASEFFPDMAFASPAFENGSLLWTGSPGDSLILRAIHRAAGHEAELLWDRAADDSGEAYVVLTSWNLHEDEPDLTEEEVVAEVVFVGQSEEAPSDAMLPILTDGLHGGDVSEVMSEPVLDDHGDHYHVTTILRLPGEALRPLLSEVGPRLVGRLGYSILAGD